MYYYALVLRKTTPVSTVDQAQTVIQRYYKYLRYVQRLYPSIYVNPTLETKLKMNGRHNVHLHAMVKSHFLIDQMPKERGLHIYFERAQSELAWNAYCAKDNTDEQTVLDLIEAYNDSSVAPRSPTEGMPREYKKINLFALADKRISEK